jgi:hypothetical protein
MIDYLKIVWDIASFISTALVILSTLIAIYYCARGFVPVLIRLGNGLWKRRIALFASGDNLTSLKALLDDSRLFNKSNIKCISSAQDLEKAESADVFIVHWQDFNKYLDDVLKLKKERTALIIHAPPGQGAIPQDDMKKLELKKHVVVNNFRGRLLNDIVTSMITSGYEKN